MSCRVETDLTRELLIDSTPEQITRAHMTLQQSRERCIESCTASWPRISLRLGRVQKLPPGSYAKSPTGDVFVKASTKKGILPEILEELLGARKRCAFHVIYSQDPHVAPDPARGGL